MIKQFFFFIERFKILLSKTPKTETEIEKRTESSRLTETEISSNKSNN